MKKIASVAGGARSQAGRGSSEIAGERPTTGTVWSRQGNRVVPLAVTLGATDGARTEVSGPGVTEGIEIVMGELDPGEAAQVNNPFTPNFRRGR